MDGARWNHCHHGARRGCVRQHLLDIDASDLVLISNIYFSLAIGVSSDVYTVAAAAQNGVGAEMES